MGREEIWYRFHNPEAWRFLANRGGENIRLESTRISVDDYGGVYGKFTIVFGQALTFVLPGPLLHVGDIRPWRYFPNGVVVAASYFTATCRLISVRQRRNMIRVVLEPLDPWMEDEVK